MNKGNMNSAGGVHLMKSSRGRTVSLNLCAVVFLVLGSVVAFAQEEFLMEVVDEPIMTAEKTPNENAEQFETDPAEKEKIPTSENPKYKDWELTYLFGTPEPTGKDLTATFYCMKRPVGKIEYAVSQKYYKKVDEFIDGGWNSELLDDFYHSPSNLYAQCIAIPQARGIMAPFSFGESDYLKFDGCWLVHYQGKIMHKDGITFRFWGVSDAVLDVGIDKKVVLAANLPWDGMDAYRIAEEFYNGPLAEGSRSAALFDDGIYRPLSPVSLVGSDWITLQPGQVYDFDAVVGAGQTGPFYAMLMVEAFGESYAMNDQDELVFPLFATQPLSWEVQDAILMTLMKKARDVMEIRNFFMCE